MQIQYCQDFCYNFKYVTNWKFLIFFSEYFDVIEANETDLAYAVLKTPVAVAIDAGEDSFQYYSGGVYDEPSCKSDVDDLDHGTFRIPNHSNC